MTIRKVKGGKHRLVSKTGKNLGTFASKQAAKKREQKDIQFRVFNYDNIDDADMLLNLMEKKPRATFRDYVIGNPVSFNGGHQVGIEHQSIVDYIKVNLNPNDNPDDFETVFNHLDFVEVFNDMKYYCDMVNGEVS